MDGLGGNTCLSFAQVEPFDRALKSLEVDCMINGRRRDHGAERAFLEVTADVAPAIEAPESTHVNQCTHGCQALNARMPEQSRAARHD